MTFSDPKRKPDAVRNTATTLSTENGLLNHEANGDEDKPYLFSFTKGLSHEQNGLLTDTKDFEAFAEGTEAHAPGEFAKTQPYRGDFPKPDLSGDPIEGAGYRRWESPTAGHAYVMEGPDPYAVTMPPAPQVGSAEFAAEIAEVYQMALGRDLAVAAHMDKSLVKKLEPVEGGTYSDECKALIEKDNEAAHEVADSLSKMSWFRGDANEDVNDHRRYGEAQGLNNLFRGTGEDAWATPYLSQFMVMGSGGKDPQKRQNNRKDGIITYGAQRIKQEVRVARPSKDYMTGWQDWLNVQNGLDARPLLPNQGNESEFTGAYRPISKMRDIATYVHDDQLYQAYFNAALILLDEGFALDPGIPYHTTSNNKFPFPGAQEIEGDDDVKRPDNNRSPFALFGPPHLLTLVTEVSSRALKAVRLQKFAVHRRLRPEAAGALFHTVYSGYNPAWDIYGAQPYDENGNTDSAKARKLLASTVARYTFPQDPAVEGSEPELENILTKIREHNETQNGHKLKPSWLLPMAFPEGSPMHPSYGAGHATVAAACVTLLKAFFAMQDGKGDPIYVVQPGEPALVPSCGENPSDGLLKVKIDKGLTLQGELNKLMANISIGRNIGGVHYYTDYIESALLGEAITIGILREQMLAYHEDENVQMTVPLLVSRTLPATLLSGQKTLTDKDVVSAIVIKSDGTLAEASG